MKTTRLPILLACVAAASGALAAPALGHPTGPQQLEVPRDVPSRGLIYDGLERVASGPCENAYRLVRTGGCTHGPDAAPPGVDVAADAPPVSFPSGASPRVQCDGNGTGGNRVEVLYARASDVTDRFSQYADSFRQWAADADRIVRNSATATDGERHIRFVTDTPDCRVKVTHVTIDPADDDDFDATIDALESRGYTSTQRKYLVFVDANVICGQGEIEDDDGDSASNDNNTGPHFSRVDAGCWGGYAAAHELVHNLGGAQLSAPHSSNGWHCTDEYDVLCYSDEPDFPALSYPCGGDYELLLDCNHDDYFHTAPPAGSYLDTHWNTADNQFLVAGRQSLWGWVWASDATAASYTPHPAYQRNSTGAINTIERTGTGAYTITFPNLGVYRYPNGGGGVVHATAYGTGNEMCKVKRWARTFTDLDGDLTVEIRCFTAAGAPVDTRFAASFARPAPGAGDRFGHVWADQPSAASYAPSQAFSYNSAGFANRITRTGTGRYEVRLPRIGGSGGAQVTAYGSSGTETCRVVGTRDEIVGTRNVGTPTEPEIVVDIDELVDVACHGAAGAAVDAYFTLTFHGGQDGLVGVPTRPGSPRAYVITDQPSAALHTPAKRFNSSGGANTVSRSAAGVYQVRLPGLGTTRGHVQVSAVSPTAQPHRCKVASWTWSGADQLVNVRCFDSAGVASDSRFAMSFAD